MEFAMSEPATSSPMMIRLANVICWGFTALAILSAAIGALGLVLGNGSGDLEKVVVFFVIAAALYGIGRGVRYVIAAR
ncbi:hypothetical protein ASC96_08735 [Rhizobium sp. Root1204]|nr:hypothetical protein ASC96_08735 [Rhizobium sp. Root1204]